jgi:MscS family membrane protein
MTVSVNTRQLGACLLALAVPVLAARAQSLPATTPVQAPAPPPTPTDPLGRDTPRGTVLGFLNAARQGEYELARQYLSTTVSAADGEVLARQLFLVLDARLPARLAQLSDTPDGSRANPLKPDEEVVGTIAAAAGDVPIVLERVTRGEVGRIWLFSAATLDVMPGLHAEVTADRVLPRLAQWQVGGAPLVEWAAVLLGLLLVYAGIGLLNRTLLPVVMGRLWRRLLGQAAPAGVGLPLPARVLVLALTARWLLSVVPLSLLVRQVSYSVTKIVTIASVAWLLMLLNGRMEASARRASRLGVAAVAAHVRLIRRGVDLLILFAGFIAALHYFGIDPTPALAGLGVGGIALALAAQRTLENVIAGASLVFDHAVRVGDFLKMGEILGTVDQVGLRSTRIRTLDRTIVSIPNGQIANMSLETLSARDKFWFHPRIALRYGTTPGQIRAVVDGVQRMLLEHPSVDPESVRVRFFALGPFSLDIDVFAYLVAQDWNHFLAIQEQLLFGVADIVERAGTAIALPWPSMSVAAGALTGSGLVR